MIAPIAAGYGSRIAAPRYTLADRVLSGLATGPVGRVAAFVADLAAYWWSWARRRIRERR